VLPDAKVIVTDESSGVSTVLPLESFVTSEKSQNDTEN
jgi:hypothetical protein